MVKTKFVSDYQINSSKKILFPYLSTASGLSEWFADDVNITHDKIFIFKIDGDVLHARLVICKNLFHVKFEFFDPLDTSDTDHSYLEFILDENELTQSLFLKVIDYSDSYDNEEMQFIWTSLISQLKEIIGG
jgi:hypothetical protein